MKKHILITLLFATILSSCSIEKRVYQSGYYISGRNSSHDDIDVPQVIKSIAFKEPETLEKESEAVIVATEQYSTSTLTSNYSDSIIKDYNLSNIIQTNKILTKTYSDSIPDDGKVLLANYEKNYKAKKKIKKIGFYPFIVTAFGFLMTGIFFVPWAFGALNNDNVFLTFLLTFLIGLAVLIPFIIVYIILTIIIKKERRKLRRMGLVK